MALTFTTGMNLIASGDSTTDYDAVRWSGSGSAPGIAAADDNVEGTGAIQSKLAGNNWHSAVMFDYYTANASTALDLTVSGNEIICGWFKYGLTGQSLAIASGGLFLAVSSSTETGTSTPTDYDEWYIGGNDFYLTSQNGWYFFMIDTRKASSLQTGTLDLSAVRRIGVGVRNDGTLGGGVKGEPFYLDAMWYGRPLYTVEGDGSTVATLDDFLTDSETTNENGLIQDIGGALAFRCGIQIGTTGQSSTTDLTDATGTVSIFQRIQYHTGGHFADAINYEEIYKIEAFGNGATTTNVTLGAVVSTGDTRQGNGGGLFSVSDPIVEFTVDMATDIADLSAVELYGVQFVGSGVQQYENATKTDIIGCGFTQCGEIQPGAAEFLNNTLSAPKGRGVLMKATNNIKNLNCIAGSGTGLVTEVGTRTQSTGQNTPRSFSHTVASGTDMLVVSLGISDSVTLEEETVAFDGVSLTQVHSIVGVTDTTLKVYFYILRNPPITTGNVTLSWSANASNSVTTLAVNLQNAGQVAVFSSEEFNSSTALQIDTHPAEDTYLLCQVSKSVVSSVTAVGLTAINSLAVYAPQLFTTDNTAASRGISSGVNINAVLGMLEVRGVGTEHHILHDDVGDATITHDNIQMFGHGAAGGPKWHGENSESAADITIAATNGANADGAEFENTGAPTEGTITVENAVTLRIEGLTEGAAGDIRATETVGTITAGDILLQGLADANGVIEDTNFNYESAFEPSGLDLEYTVRGSGLPIAAIADDNGSYTDETTAANSSTDDDMTLLPATAVVNQDAYLFGHAEQFGGIKIYISQVATGGGTITWEYWDGGAFVALSNVNDETTSFSVAGENYIEFDIPGDWATSTINSQGPYYYVRGRYTAGTITQQPLGRNASLDVTNYLNDTGDRTLPSTGLTIIPSWVEDRIKRFRPPT